MKKTYDQTVNQKAKIVLTTSKKKGATVRMGMENAECVGYIAKVSGRVDFR